MLSLLVRVIATLPPSSPSPPLAPAPPEIPLVLAADDDSARLSLLSLLIGVTILAAVAILASFLE
jgi:hypothetical protein